MRVLFALVVMLSMVGFGYAGGQHHKKSHSVVGPQGEVGPMGPQGPQGPKGDPGVPGKDGNDALDATRLNIGADVRWYDWKHFSLNSGYRYDLNHHGHVVDIGVIALKLGRSYEGREIDELKRLTEAQTAVITEQMKQLQTMQEQPSTETQKAVIRGAQ